MSEPAKRGRPAKPSAERRRHNQTFRCNDELHSRLQSAAEQNQRSISEEVERRLETSFEIIKPSQAGDYLASIKRIVGGDEGFSDSVELGLMWKRVKERYEYKYSESRGHWFDNEENCKVVLGDFNRSLERLMLSLIFRARQDSSGEK